MRLLAMCGLDQSETDRLWRAGWVSEESPSVLFSFRSSVAAVRGAHQQDGQGVIENSLCACVGGGV